MEYSNQDDERHTRRASESNGITESSEEPRSKSAQDIAAAYAEVARGLERWRRLDELFAGRYRRRQSGSANGSVLDVACGTGRNVQYLSAVTEIVDIDIGEALLTDAGDGLRSITAAVGSPGELNP